MHRRRRAGMTPRRPADQYHAARGRETISPAAFPTMYFAYDRKRIFAILRASLDRGLTCIGRVGPSLPKPPPDGAEL